MGKTVGRHVSVVWRKLLSSHCTTTSSAARRHLLRRDVRRRVSLSRTLSAALLVVALALAAAVPMASAQPRNTWWSMFELQPGVTYTYTLTYEPARRSSGWSPWDWDWDGPGSPWGGGVGRRDDGVVRGELNLWRSGGARDEVRFWFTFGDVRVNGTAPVDPQAVAGAVLVAALTSADPIPAEGVSLLATVFHWTKWRDLFEKSTFRDGTVWEVVQHPPHRFTARQERFFNTYRGEITRGRDTVLELTIDLAQPLPLEIVAHEGRDRYVVQLVQQPVTGPRR